MDPYDDDYDIFNPKIGGGPTVIRHMPSEEEKTYHELIGLYQGNINETGQCTDSFLWESFNDAMDSLVARNHTHYGKFKISPTNMGSIRFIYYPSFRSQLMRALQRMSQDFELADPSYLIHAHLPKTGTHISNSQTQQNDQSNFQTQKQNQTVELNLEQRIELIEQELEEKLTEEQLTEIKPALEEFKAEPTKWSKASKLINAVLGLSKDVAVGVISNIIAAQIGLPQA